jgi:hypothetical protein
MPPHPAQVSDDPLYRAAIDVERDEGLATEMAEWEVATIADGLADECPEKPVA